MIKTVRIGEHDYNMKSSAFTMFAYKNQTGRSLIGDINDLYKKFKVLSELNQEEQNETMLEELNDIAEKTLRLAHIMILEYDKTFTPYEEFLKELDGLFEDVNWILEVLEMGMSPIQGRISNSQQ